MRGWIWVPVVLAACSKPPGPNVTDADGDGYVAADDCNDADADVFPGGEEVPGDDLDNDCDPATPDADADGDGVATGNDCDDEASWMGVGQTTLTDAEIAVTNPAEAEAFCGGYCRVTVTGRLTVLGVDQLEYLSCLADVEELEIRGTAAPGMEAFTRLERIGKLTVQEAGLMEDLLGLDNVAEIGSLTVVNNRRMKSLRGISVKGLDRLSVREMPALTSLVGLGTIRTLGDLGLRDNPALADLEGLEHLASVSGDVEIVNNAELVSLSEAADLESVGGDLTITDNPKLSSVEISSWLDNVAVSGATTIENNAP